MMFQRSSLRRPRAAVLLVAALAGAAAGLAAAQAPAESATAPIASDATSTSTSAPIVEIPSITVGEPFPELVLPTLDGQPMSLASMRGHRTMLHVFASW